MRGLARVSRLGMLAVALIAAGTLGCDVNDKLLSATDPDLINPSDLDTPEGATALRVGALRRWQLATGGDNSNGRESTWLTGGLLADEWATSSTFVQNDELDERRIKLDNSTVTFDFRKLEQVRTAVNQALPAMTKWRPTETANIAELYLARGQAEMQLASDFCNGIPLSDGTTSPVTPGKQLMVAQVFDVAIATLDSGLALLPANDASDIGRALRVIKARALLGNAKFSDARQTIDAISIPTDWTYNHTYAATSGSNAIWGQAMSGMRYLVGDSLEGNSRNLLVKNNIPFFSSQDPRVPANYTINVKNGKADTTKSQDGLTYARTTPLWGQETAVAVANGIDARLIEAEVAYHLDQDFPAALAILNGLRSAQHKLGTITTPVMTPLVDPGTPDARLTMLFREKAFWTFSRGQRLGDMRRLIRQYGLTADQVFPTGEHYRGGTYGTDVNLPVPKEEEFNNPNVTQSCLDRNA